MKRNRERIRYAFINRRVLQACSTSTLGHHHYTHHYEHGTRVGHCLVPLDCLVMEGFHPQKSRRKTPERGGSSRILQDPLRIPPGTMDNPGPKPCGFSLGTQPKKNLTLHMGGARGALPGDPGAKNSWLQALRIFSWGPALTPSSHLTLMGCKVPAAPKNLTWMGTRPYSLLTFNPNGV